ncbi:hypothetical protein SAMN05428988_3248 [Chitinophaga sp. YR573]|uniref:hypothetical protein n=1 Tax=Chitinophaga sp. YR573 TaxID=1881040 RepID=UPI0008CB1367|nr:hypothetical protein [Chitinophaga sp. YR573]SEW21777.1 hypothetical protein SAMN05428988_3248 [Chitinophaga sp. YR573]
MVNQNFLSTIRIGERTISLVPDQTISNSCKFIASAGNRIPFILCFTSLGYLTLPSGPNGYKRLFDTDIVIQIFQDGSEIIKIPIRNRVYYVGKGIIMDSEFNILAMLTVTEEFYHFYMEFTELLPDHISKHFTLVISNKFEKQKEFKTLYAKFRKLYKGQTINLHFTKNPEYESFVHLKVPYFSTMEERKEYIEKFTTDVIENVLISQVIE